MALKCGIVGLPNVGKSTLFNCLSNAKAQSANFPFCTIEPNVGVITVPDERLLKLAELVHPQKIVPNTVEIVDIAGLVKGAHKGEGLGNKFLANIRETNAIIHVIRCFNDDNVVHVDGSVDPVRDKEVVDYELQLKDLETINSHIKSVEKRAFSGVKEARKLLELYLIIKKQLESGKSARVLTMDINDKELIADLNLLTAKPVLYVCNVDEASVISGNEYTEKIASLIKDEASELLIVGAEIEAEIATLETFEERKMFLDELGLEQAGVSKLITTAYRLLNLQTFFTAGEKEAKAWTIKKNTKAPQAAGVIHSDFERGFIRAEVIAYKDFIKYGSESACRDVGKLSVEGKEYIVNDGDVMHFKFNV